ncbi:MAG: tRNA lysidine(34) synthetase TilS [Bacilli bacterium]
MDVGKGTKKIKDILIDEKIPIRKRNDCLLLTNKNNEVLCVLGVKKAATLKINKSNDTIIELIRR